MPFPTSVLTRRKNIRRGVFTLVASVILLPSGLGAQSRIRPGAQNGASTPLIRPGGPAAPSSASQGAQMGYIPGMPLPSADPDSGGSQSVKRITSESAQEGSANADTGPAPDATIGIHTVDRRARSRSALEAKESEEIYSGIIPGKRDQVAHLSRADKKGQKPTNPNFLTWVGFRSEPTYTRVFLQAARTPQYDWNRDASKGTIRVVLKNTKIPSRNFSRFLDTRFYDRPVTRIETSKMAGEDVLVEIFLRTDIKPSFEQEGEYLFIDFPEPKTARALDEMEQPSNSE